MPKIEIHISHINTKGQYDFSQYYNVKAALEHFAAGADLKLENARTQGDSYRYDVDAASVHTLSQAISRSLSDIAHITQTRNTIDITPVL